MVSGRFNDNGMVDYIKYVRDILTQKGVPIFMVDTQGPGDAFGSKTLRGLYTAKALLAFCGANYGERTGDFARDLWLRRFLSQDYEELRVPPKRSIA